MPILTRFHLFSQVDEAPPPSFTNVDDQGDGWFSGVYRVAASAALAASLAAFKPYVPPVTDEVVPAVAVPLEQDALPPTISWPARFACPAISDEFIWTPQPQATSAITVAFLAGGTATGPISDFDFGPFNVTAGRVYVLVLDTVNDNLSPVLTDTPTSGGAGINWSPGVGDQQIECFYDVRLPGVYKRYMAAWIGYAGLTESVLPNVSFLDGSDSLRWVVLEVTGAAIDTFLVSPVPLAQILALKQYGVSAHDAETRPTTTLLNLVDPRSAIIGFFGRERAISNPLFTNLPLIDLDEESTSLGDLHSGWFPGGIGYPSVLQDWLGDFPVEETGRNSAGIALEIVAGISVDEGVFVPLNVQLSIFSGSKTPIGDDGDRITSTVPDEDVVPDVAVRRAVWNARAILDTDDIAPSVTVVDEDAAPNLLPWRVAPWRGHAVLETDENAPVMVDEDGVLVLAPWRVSRIAPAILDTEDIVPQATVVDEDAAFTLGVHHSARSAGAILDTEEIVPQSINVDEDAGPVAGSHRVAWFAPISGDGDETVPQVFVLDEDRWVAEGRWVRWPVSQPLGDDGDRVTVITIVEDEGRMAVAVWPRRFLPGILVGDLDIGPVFEFQSRKVIVVTRKEGAMASGHATGIIVMKKDTVAPSGDKDIIIDGKDGRSA